MDVHRNSVSCLAKMAGRHARDAHDEIVVFSPSDPRGPVRRDVGVGKKQKNCHPASPDDDHKGEWWDHVAFDPAHKLVLAVIPGARVTESVAEVAEEVEDRLEGQAAALMSSDEYPVHETVIEQGFSQPVVAPPEPSRPGRRPLLPARSLDPGVRYATVRKERKNNRVVAVHRAVLLGSRQAIEGVLRASACSRTINTSFVVRQHATARCQNARRSRRTYWFSKDSEIHEDDFVSQRQSGTEPCARVIIPSTDGKSTGPPPRSFRTTFRSAIPSGRRPCRSFSRSF